jgi:hypothetical protein
MRYKATVKDKTTGERITIESDYPNKTAFIKDLRANGYSVSNHKVKLAAEWNRIMNKTNATKKDWRNK